MGELEGIHEDVPFDWDGADALVAKFRSTASRLDGQVPRREADAEDAREEWRGVYADRFGGRVRICTGDAKGIAGAMETAAHQLEELARLAREEQDRRLKAREWEQQERDEGLLEKGVEVFTGERDKPPPVDYGERRRYTAEPHSPGARD